MKTTGWSVRILVLFIPVFIFGSHQSAQAQSNVRYSRVVSTGPSLNRAMSMQGDYNLWADQGPGFSMGVAREAMHEHFVFQVGGGYRYASVRANEEIRFYSARSSLVGDHLGDTRVESEQYAYQLHLINMGARAGYSQPVSSRWRLIGTAGLDANFVLNREHILVGRTVFPTGVHDRSVDMPTRMKPFFSLTLQAAARYRVNEIFSVQIEPSARIGLGSFTKEVGMREKLNRLNEFPLTVGLVWGL